MSFLEIPEPTADAQQIYDNDLAGLGFVMNLSRVWAHIPTIRNGLFGLMDDAATAAGLTFRQRGVLVVALASTLGDAYCSYAWGRKLADAAGEQVAGGVVRGDDSHLEPAEQALAGWARTIVRDPNATGPRDVQVLRDAGYTDRQIFAITVFVALRSAFAMVNDSLGALPDDEVVGNAPAVVRDAVTWGRPETRAAAALR